MTVAAVEKGNPLLQLVDLGQSVWLDYIRRSLITSGELKRLVDEDGLRGMTSNPSIFEKAIAGSTDYTDILKELNRQPLTAAEKFERIAVRDIRDACDVLRTVYDRTQGRDGYVSIEVSPLLAKNTQQTIEEARRLWKEIGRPNVMVKVPGTPEGLPAVLQLLSEGININITLLFAQEVHALVADTYIQALEKRAAKGEDISRIGSVASFFVSRIDNVADKQLEDKAKQAKDAKERDRLSALEGKTAIANAKMAYKKYQELFSGLRWEKLAAKGAKTQRVLWASTSTKNPKYPDTLYVDTLIGPDTVNTIPPATLNAFREHGKPEVTLTQDVDGAAKMLADLEASGISLKQITSDLLDDGVKLFREAFEQLLGAIEKSAEKPAKINQIRSSLPDAQRKAVDDTLADWDKNQKVSRLWRRDASLWTNKDEANWLGWLGIAEDEIAHAQALLDVAAEVKKEGFTHALLLGMGGSSLCPEVTAMTFGKQDGAPELHILDSTDPEQIAAVEKSIDIAKTIFIVSSKSGTTLEPNIYKQYFFERVKQAVGADKAGSRFLAITDPGSKMQQVAEADKFRHIFYGLPSIGGRYSALSNFGMVPMAIAGVNVGKFLERTEIMVQACHQTVGAAENPGVVLGAILGTLGIQGRNKVTIFASPGIFDIGAWLEQLLAESTGKIGRGLIPVDRESIGAPERYGNDRVFIYVRLTPAPDAEQDKKIDALEKAGQPVVRINVADIYDLGQEYFRWEIATAVAGSIIGINAFDQPDVEASKIATRALTSEYEKNGSLPAEEPGFEQDGIRLYTDEANWAELQKGEKSLTGILKAHLDRLGAGDYLGLLAYIPMNAENEAALQKTRHRVRDAKKAATCLGFGPRFLHSTGQAYKGGPNSGVFLQITCEHAKDLPVPGQKYTFGVVQAAQARGDFTVLTERKRRALRVHLPADIQGGLGKLDAAVAAALSK